MDQDLVNLLDAYEKKAAFWENFKGADVWITERSQARAQVWQQAADMLQEILTQGGIIG